MEKEYSNKTLTKRIDKLESKLEFLISELRRRGIFDEA